MQVVEKLKATMNRQHEARHDLGMIVAINNQALNERAEKRKRQAEEISRSLEHTYLGRYFDKRASSRGSFSSLEQSPARRIMPPKVNEAEAQEKLIKSLEAQHKQIMMENRRHQGAGSAMGHEKPNRTSKQNFWQGVRMVSLDSPNLPTIKQHLQSKGRRKRKHSRLLDPKDCRSN